MNAAIEFRMIVPAEIVPRGDTLWQRFKHWWLTVPPNPLVWYAPCDWPDDAAHAPRTAFRPLVLVPHDE
jgi:hypothetical protein